MNDLIESDNYLVSSNSCNSYDLEEINKEVPLLESKLNILHLNIRSCNTKFDELIAFLEMVKMKFSIVVLSETWIKDSSDHINLPGFVSYHSIRQGIRRGGGVSIFIDKNIDSTDLPNFFVNNEAFDCAGIRATVGKEVINIIGVYRPPRSSDGYQTLDRFNSMFPDLLQTLAPNQRNLIVGDFNVDLLKDEPSNSERNFKEHFASLFYLPLINVPTRETDETSTCIDNIYSNNLDPTYSGTLSCNMSDHHAIFSTIPINEYSGNENIEFSFRCHSTQNIINFRRELEDNLSFFTLYDDFPINERFEIFSDIVRKTYEKNCPIKRKILSLKRIRAPWINNSLRMAIDEKHRFLKLTKSNPLLIEQFKIFCNDLKKFILDTKKKYYYDKFENISRDVKATWKVINSLIKPIKSRNSLKLNIDGILTEDPPTLANTFNDHFVSVAPLLASKIPSVNTDPTYYVNRNPNSFMYFPCTHDEIEKIIRGLKNKKGSLGEIPVSMLKKITDLVCPILSKLFNQSVSLGSFPEILKVAKIVPIYKSGTKTDKNNYRPIALLPTLSKVFEKLIHKRVTSFLTKFDLLYSDQYGFQSKKSTTDAILKFTDKCYDALNNKKALISVYIDFSKAFDTVDHVILLKKLEIYGFRGAILGWFQSYLSARHQYVEMKGSKSSLQSNPCGVPQGSVLGPLLFLIYINDMNRCCKLNIINFADDSTAYLTHDDLRSAIQLVNRELDSLDQWVCANKLSLNTSKTAYTIISNQRQSDIPGVIIRNTEIAACKEQKFLGIILDNKLNFKNHIDKISNKVKSANGILWKLSQYVPSQVLKKIYYTLVYPFLIYGVEIWGNSSQVGLNRLSRLVHTAQKRTKSQTNLAHNSKIFLSVSQIHQFYTLLRCYKYYKLKSNTYFYEKFSSRHPTHDINTRFNHNNNFNTPPIAISKMFCSFFISGITFWNALPPCIRDCNNISSFKNKTKRYLETQTQTSSHQ